MSTFRRLCVYCGSSTGSDPVYAEAARAMAGALVDRGIGLVYGGGSVGLMGVLADAVLAGGGEVIGVIPDKLQALELGHTGCTELFVVDSMHARKLIMAQLSDGFVAMPGGFGTLEELFEVTTWTQLNYHRKPIGVLNAAGYYDGLLGFLDHAVQQGFIRDLHRPLVQSSADPATLLDQMAAADLPELHRWIERP